MIKLHRTTKGICNSLSPRQQHYVFDEPISQIFRSCQLPLDINYIMKTVVQLEVFLKIKSLKKSPLKKVP